MASSILHSQSPILQHSAAVFAFFPALVGAVGLFFPRLVLAGAFEFEMPASPKDQKLVDSLMRLFCVRDLFLGGVALAAWYNEDQKTLGAIMLLGAGVVFTDGAVNKHQTGRGAWKHWTFVPVMAGIGAGLLGWLDGLVAA
ncbi:hypothetical protein LTR36_008740 [Oleoguttula mirabilis]|uniref:Uncharacterized protein n=1 Tax=Oleoguttula mirabilis TaxID=1507867 RepID=A0AAV9JTL9_9PEZI|nr:hypothetical protein LTR36_008740 [Oleoguttula mirabilis]